jgi:hypothetical protein
MPGVPAHLAEKYRKDSEDNLANVHDLFHRISIKGSRFKVDGKVIGNEGITFDAIVLRETPVNLYYLNRYNQDDPTSPDCWSLGGIKPDVSCSSPQSATCAPCRHNKFGSGTDEKGVKTRGKACKNTRRLVLKYRGVDMPVLLSLPATSVKLFNQFLKTLSSNEPPIPMFALRTIFGFDTEAEYPRPTMAVGTFLNESEYDAIAEMRLSELVEEALNAYASPSDVVEDPAEAPEAGSETGTGKF